MQSLEVQFCTVMKRNESETNNATILKENKYRNWLCNTDAS